MRKAPAKVLMQMATLTALVGCGVAVDQVAQPSLLQGYPNMDKRWPSRTIAVCWEASAHPWQVEREIVQLALEREYERKTMVRFTGWQACPEPQWPLPYHFDGISVAIKNSGGRAHTSGLGTDLRDKPKGLLLNFRFAEVEGLEECVGDERNCIDALAVHEFGHAIGMAHEQNRPDTPGWCNNRQGSNGTLAVGRWDMDSVMNYCNPIWNANGKLSPKDIDTIQTMYPDPTWAGKADFLISQKYSQLGGAAGALGPRLAGTQAARDSYGYFQAFAHGRIYATPGRGALEVYGEIGKLFGQLDFERFAYPVTGEMGLPDGVGRANHFEDGRSIYWSPRSGAHEVYGAIRFLWASLGWEASYLGYPVSGEHSTPDGRARVSHFQNGSIYFRPEVGSIAVPGVIMAEWGKHSYERGALRYPIDQPTMVGSGLTFQNFEGGRVYWNRSRGSWVVWN